MFLSFLFGKAKKADAPPQGFAHVFKRNPYHDERGRFTTKDKAVGPKGPQDKSTGMGQDISLAQWNELHDDPTVKPKDILDRLGVSKRVRKEIAHLEVKANNTPPTSILYTDSEGRYNQPYTDEDGNTYPRHKLHDKIIAKILNEATIRAATPAEGEAPTLVLLGGRGGSGKSSFTNGTLGEFDARKFIKLDSDDIKQQLIPPYKGWNAASVHEESKFIAQKITTIAKALRLNLIQDITMGNSQIKTIEAFKSKGYEVEGHYMYVPRQESATRALRRYLGDGPGKRGRLVPTEVVLGMTNNEKFFDEAKPYFKKWSAYDNQGEAPKLIARGERKQ